MKTALLFLLLVPLQLSSQVLLPGDANNDGRVNHVDLLAIGLNFGQTGPPRSAAFPGHQLDTESPSRFGPLLCPPPVSTTVFPTAMAMELSVAEDILALKFNYDSTHNQSQPPPQPYQPIRARPHNGTAQIGVPLRQRYRDRSTTPCGSASFTVIRPPCRRRFRRWGWPSPSNSTRSILRIA
jgi:hypothetical protein